MYHAQIYEETPCGIARVAHLLHSHVMNAEQRDDGYQKNKETMLAAKTHKGGDKAYAMGYIAKAIKYHE
eukprot:411743-Pelagomonas_calceolata.AAC.4